MAKSDMDIRRNGIKNVSLCVCIVMAVRCTNVGMLLLHDTCDIPILL